MENILNTINKIIAILCIIILSGCAGIGIYKESGYKKSIDNPAISKGFVKVSNIPNNVPINDYTLKIYWGLPYKINDLSQNTSEWIYELIEYEWRGLFILVGIIPVPIGLPIGKEEVRVILENGYVKKVYIEDSHESALGYLLFIIGPCGPGFFMPVAFDRDKNNHIEGHRDWLITQSIEAESLVICEKCGQPYFKKDIKTDTCGICNGALVSLDEFYLTNSYNEATKKMRYEVELKDKSSKSYYYKPFP